MAKPEITTYQIKVGTIQNEDISESAAISLTKLSETVATPSSVAADISVAIANRPTRGYVDAAIVEAVTVTTTDFGEY